MTLKNTKQKLKKEKKKTFREYVNAKINTRSGKGGGGRGVGKRASCLHH